MFFCHQTVSSFCVIALVIQIRNTAPDLSGKCVGCATKFESMDSS